MCGPSPEVSLRRLLPHDATAPARARDMVAEAAHALPLTTVESAQLIVSELVTNSVRHADPSGDRGIDVSIRVQDGTLCGEVHDGGQAREEPEADAGLGMGLVIVDRLAGDWGTEITDDGRTTWFAVPAPT